jgi:predicted phosphodiesterase
MIDKEILLDLIKTTGQATTRGYIEAHYGISEYKARRYVTILENLDLLSSVFENDKELVAANINYKKQTQRYSDLNRIERKHKREDFRIVNAIEEYTKELIEVFTNNPIQVKTTKHKIVNKSIGVLHFTDSHFNELVELPSNTFDFNIASKRVQKYIDKSKQYFKAKGIKTVLFAMTGDLLNSDRRLDELLSNATNRSKATFLAAQILINAIIDLNKDFNVNVISVVGNESRVNKDIGWINQVASDSYDLTIYNIMELVLRNKPGIKFIEGDKLESVVNVAGYNWLLTHGHKPKFKKPGDAVGSLVRMYADQRIIIRFVLFGHIHEALITDMYARGASIVGANAYSKEALLLTSRASLNSHAAYENGEIDSLKIDLQETKGYKGYPIQEELKAYNAKSADKAHENVSIMKIVI